MTLSLRIATALDAEALTALRPEVEEALRQVLTAFHIPELDAEKLLHETVIEMLYKAEGPADFGRRVGPVLQAKCRTYWQTRRWRHFNNLVKCDPPAAAEPLRESRGTHPHESSASEHAGARTTGLSRRLFTALLRHRMD
jgi:hypothetical protein